MILILIRLRMAARFLQWWNKLMKCKDIPTKVLKPRASNHEAAITSFMALLEVIPETWANFITLLLNKLLWTLGVSQRTFDCGPPVRDPQVVVISDKISAAITSEAPHEPAIQPSRTPGTLLPRPAEGRRDYRIRASLRPGFRKDSLARAGDTKLD